MAWGDPAAQGDPNASYLSQNPAIRDALLMFGANMLANARQPGMQGIGESLGTGFNTWAQRRAQYDKEMREKQIQADLALGKKPQLGSMYAPPGRPLAAPDAGMIGVGAANLGTPTAAPNLGAPDFSANPYYRPPAGAQQPQSPFGPGPWGTAAPSPPAPVGTAGFTLANPYPMGGPLNVVPLGSQGPSAPGLFNLASAGGGSSGRPFGGATGSEVQLGGAGQDVLDKQPLWARNNNPGNLRYVGQEGATEGENGFARFPTMEAGVAAAKQQLARYGKGTSATGGRPLNTLRQIISTYSPPGENQTEALIKNAAQRMGVAPDQPLDMADSAVLDQLTNAMVQQETGRTVAGLGGGTPSTPVRGSQARAVMAGGAEGDVPQPPSYTFPLQPQAMTRADVGGGAIPSQPPGLLGQADEDGGLYTATGEFNEDAKRTLSYALKAGGTEGFQQALMTLAQQKPTTFGNEQQGLFKVDPWSGRVSQLAPGTGPKRTTRLTDEDVGFQIPTGEIWTQDNSGDIEVKGHAIKNKQILTASDLQAIQQAQPDFRPTPGSLYSMDEAGDISELKGGDWFKIIPHDQVKARTGTEPQPGTIYQQKQGTDQITATGPGGTTVNIDTKAQQGWMTGDMARSQSWTDSAASMQSNLAAMGPATEWLKNAVLEGKEVTGGWASKSLGTRRLLQEWGLPAGENVGEQEMLEGLKAGLMSALHEKGMGPASDWESKAYVAGGPSLDKSTEGNYLLVKGLEAQAARKEWLGTQSRRYMNTKDPETGEKRNSLDGFEEWLRTPDADGHAPIEDLPHMMTDTSTRSAEDVIRNTSPGDVLFVDGQIKVRPRQIPDGDRMSIQEANQLKSGGLVVLDGKVRLVP